MTTLLIDSSVVIKWLHRENESEVVEARALRAATRRGDIECRMIDLALYEIGNVLLRALGWQSAEVADQLDALVVMCGPPIAMAPEWPRAAANLGATHGLTFYDACWAAAARGLGVALVSADAQLLAAGLADSPKATAERLRLPLPS